MGQSLPVRTRRRRTFLRELAAGRTVAAACEAAHVAWSTLYHWRRTDPKFRAAWDEAARHGEDALAARLDSELVRRAVDGVEEPVFHAGEEVGTRKRYSDPLLMFGVRELRDRRRGPAPVVIPPGGNSKVTVIVERLGPPTPEEMAALEPPEAVEAKGDE
jgi:hypothetical protein